MTWSVITRLKLWQNSASPGRIASLISTQDRASVYSSNCTDTRPNWSHNLEWVDSLIIWLQFLSVIWASVYTRLHLSATKCLFVFMVLNLHIFPRTSSNWWGFDIWEDPPDSTLTHLPFHLYLSFETVSFGDREVERGDQDPTYTHLLQTLYYLPTIHPYAHPLLPHPLHPGQGSGVPLWNWGWDQTGCRHLIRQLHRYQDPQWRSSMTGTCAKWCVWREKENGRALQCGFCCMVLVSRVYLRVNRQTERHDKEASVLSLANIAAQLVHTHLERVW